VISQYAFSLFIFLDALSNFLDGLWNSDSSSAVHYKSPSPSSGNADNGASEQMWLECLDAEELDAIADDIQLCLGIASNFLLTCCPIFFDKQACYF